MFLQSNNPEGLNALSKSTALVGDSDLIAPNARRAAELSQAIDAAGIPSVRLEDHGTPATVPQTKGSVLLLSAGHGYAAPVAMTWSRDAEGRLVSEDGPSGRTWSIEKAQDGAFELKASDQDKPVSRKAPDPVEIPGLSAKERQGWNTATSYVLLQPKGGKKAGKQLVPAAEVAPQELTQTLRESKQMANSQVMANPSGVTRSAFDAYFEQVNKAKGAAGLEQEAVSHLQRRAEESETGFRARRQTEERSAWVQAGHHVLSLQPPEETGSAYDPDARERVGFPARSTDLTRSDAQAMAVRMADSVVFTQVASRSEHSLKAVATAAETKTPMATLVPERHYDTLPEVGGNMALLGKGRNVPSKIGLSANGARPFETELADRRPAGKVEAGQEAAFVERLQARLDGRAAPTAKARKEGQLQAGE
jgi:hypothetical protein